ncbi:MAG: VWA domain-containing protein [Bryobacteraceae bacterium]
MRRLNKTLLAAGLVAVAAAGAWAQFVAETRLVVLHASVADKRGKLVTNLDRDSFKVFENGVPQELKLFRREDVPVSLGIIIDNSGSMRPKRERVEAAALNLVKESNPQDEVFIVNFNDEAFLDVPFTNDVKRMETGLARIDSRGGTAMRDAIDMSINYMKTDAKKDKKVILVITDGNDNASNSTLERVVQKSLQSEVLIYAIGLLVEEEKHDAAKAKRALKEITTATGGLVFYPTSVGEVQQLTNEIAHDIRNQYTLAYSPSQADDGSYRQIKVVCTAPGSPSVRTRTGYYARREDKKSANAQANPKAFTIQ